MTTGTTGPGPAEETWVRRFDLPSRLLHLALLSSFLGLALTGLPLVFAEQPWARTVNGMFGGWGVTGLIHRFFAVVLLSAFFIHLVGLFRRVFLERQFGMLWGPDSVVPQPRDVVQLLQHIRYFFGLGPRPKFERFAYWQKFDYWAVFWGMGIIGTSGLMLWFPLFFARFLPGWALNVAHIVHGEEAILAMVFIFTVHFFNENLRPEKFPMDPVMFTGRLTLEEFKHDFPGEYERAEKEGRLGEYLTTPPDRRLLLAGRVIAAIAIPLGLLMVALAIRGFLGS